MTDKKFNLKHYKPAQKLPTVKILKVLLHGSHNGFNREVRVKA